MRWLFLIFLLLLAWVGNAAVFDGFSVRRAVAGVAFNVFLSSLLVIWWGAYFVKPPRRQRCLTFGHALLTCALGVGLMGFGADAFFTGSCAGFTSSGQSNRTSIQVAAYIQNLGYCSELGIGIALLGVFFVYSSMGFFFGTTRDPDRDAADFR
jgi:hypothetical protein